MRSFVVLRNLAFAAYAVWVRHRDKHRDRNMTPNTERRKHFKKGLALVEQTQVGFAKAHGVTLQHLQEVLLGRRKSQRLNALIDEVIARVPAEMLTASTPPPAPPVPSQPAAA